MLGLLRIHATPRMQLPGQKNSLGSSQRAGWMFRGPSARKCMCVCVCVVLGMCTSASLHRDPPCQGWQAPY